MDGGISCPGKEGIISIQGALPVWEAPPVYGFACEIHAMSLISNACPGKAVCKDDDTRSNTDDEQQLPCHLRS